MEESDANLYENIMPDSEPEPPPRPPKNGDDDGARQGWCRHVSTQGNCEGEPLAKSYYCKAHSCPHSGTYGPCNKDKPTNAKDCGQHPRPDNGLPTGSVQQNSQPSEDGGGDVRRLLLLA